MLREVMVPKKKRIEIEIPVTYLGKEIEVLIFPFFEIENRGEEEKKVIDKNLEKLFKEAPNVKINGQVDIDALMNEVNDVVF